MRMLIVLMVIAGTLGQVTFAGEAKEGKGDSKIDARANRCYLEADNLELRARTADGNGDVEKAKALRECAAARDVLDKSKAVDYDKSAAAFEAKAKESDRIGKSELAAALRRCAAANRKIAEGLREASYDLIKKGHLEFNDAQSDVVKFSK